MTAAGTRADGPRAGGSVVGRREVLSLLALGAAGLLAGCGSSLPRRRIPPAVPGRPVILTRAPVPTHDIAITIDDGYDPVTLADYVTFAHDSGMALNFDAIGVLAPAWESQAPMLKPLIEKGQVQIANHTFHHLDLRQLSDTQVRSEIEQNEEWIQKTFGVTARPFLRPPSGLHDSRVDALAGELGYTKILMWQGSFGDAALITPGQLMAFARGALLPGAVVVGHANHSTVTGLYPELVELIRQRNLTPRTLDAMFGTSRAIGA